MSELGTTVVAIRSVERYPLGVLVSWTCSPATGGAASLAQATPRVELAIADSDGTRYIPLGEQASGGGRTLFGASFFGGAMPETCAGLEIAVTVSGATGADVALTSRVSFGFLA